jgi:hypothetical protein
MQTRGKALHSAREAIDQLDRIRWERGITQAELTELAGYEESRRYWRMVASGDVKLSVFLRFARAAKIGIMMLGDEEGAEGGSEHG